MTMFQSLALLHVGIRQHVYRDLDERYPLTFCGLTFDPGQRLPVILPCVHKDGVCVFARYELDGPHVDTVIMDREEFVFAGSTRPVPFLVGRCRGCGRVYVAGLND